MHCISYEQTYPDPDHFRLFVYAYLLNQFETQLLMNRAETWAGKYCTLIPAESEFKKSRNDLANFVGDPYKPNGALDLWYNEYKRCLYNND